VNATAGLLPSGLYWGANLLAGVLALWAALGAPWGLLRSNRLEHLFLGMVIAVAGLWLMRVGVRPGLDIHLLGATLLTLMFGWRLAMVNGALVLAGLSALGVHTWDGFGLNLTVLVLIPVFCSHAIGGLAYRWLPRNPFIYVLLCGFFGGIVAMLAAAGGAGLLWLTFGPYPSAVVLSDFLAILPLLAFPEGFITGAVITMLVVFKPEWVRTFDDRDYLR
jgi:uncharacterized membrane protein